MIATTADILFFFLDEKEPKNQGCMEILRLRCGKRAKIYLDKKTRPDPLAKAAPFAPLTCSNSFYQGKFFNALFPRAAGISIRPFSKSLGKQETKARLAFKSQILHLFRNRIS